MVASSGVIICIYLQNNRNNQDACSDYCGCVDGNVPVVYITL